MHETDDDNSTLSVIDSVFTRQTKVERSTIAPNQTLSISHPLCREADYADPVLRLDESPSAAPNTPILVAFQRSVSMLTPNSAQFVDLGSVGGHSELAW